MDIKAVEEQCNQELARHLNDGGPWGTFGLAALAKMSDELEACADTSDVEGEKERWLRVKILASRMLDKLGVDARAGSAHATIAALDAHCESLSLSAASARDMARICMSKTGLRVIRAELTILDNGAVEVIVCDPAGDEVATTKRLAGLLDAGILAMLGAKVDPTKEPTQRGSMA
jgi:predicted nucleic acid-binding protein